MLLTDELASLLPSFNSKCCVYVGKWCQIINRVAQGVLGRNWSLSVGQVPSIWQAVRLMHHFH